MKGTSSLFSEMILLSRLIRMVNQKKDRLLNGHLSPMDIAATQSRALCSIRCEVCITPAELKTVLSVDPGAMTRMFDRLTYKGWIEWLPNPTDKRDMLVQLTPDGATLCEQRH